MTARRLPVQVTIDVDELRTWAQRHANAGNAGVAHVLLKAAEGIESVTEQHDREVREQERARIAREIQERLTERAQQQPKVCDDSTEGWCHRDAAVSALADALRIARGES